MAHCSQAAFRKYTLTPRYLQRTKASLIYRRTKNLRAVQLLLGHTKLESTVRYLSIEIDDALELAEQTDILTVHHWLVSLAAPQSQLALSDPKQNYTA